MLREGKITQVVRIAQEAIHAKSHLTLTSKLPQSLTFLS